MPKAPLTNREPVNGCVPHCTRDHDSPHTYEQMLGKKARIHLQIQALTDIGPQERPLCDNFYCQGVGLNIQIHYCILD